MLGALSIYRIFEPNENCDVEIDERGKLGHTSGAKSGWENGGGIRSKGAGEKTVSGIKVSIEDEPAGAGIARARATCDRPQQIEARCRAEVFGF